jgi:hypothetical protein
MNSAENTWETNDFQTTEKRLHAALHAGHILNQLFWELSKYTIIHDPARGPILDNILAELQAQVIVMMPEVSTDISDRVQMIRRFWPAWRGDFGETQAEDLEKAWDSLRKDATGVHQEDIDRGQDGPVPDVSQFAIEKAFEEIIDAMNNSRKAIESTLESEIAHFPCLWDALQLGKYLDEGLRPPDVHLHLFRRVENPEWRELANRSPDANDFLPPVGASRIA